LELAVQAVQVLDTIAEQQVLIQFFQASLHQAAVVVELVIAKPQQQVVLAAVQDSI
jgi:hypothetical protein